MSVTAKEIVRQAIAVEFLLVCKIHVAWVRFIAVFNLCLQIIVPWFEVEVGEHGGIR